MSTVDFLHKKLSIGDNVVFIRPRQRDFMIGQVKEFTATNRVLVKWGEENYQEIVQEADQVLLVDSNDVTMYWLKNKGQ